MAKLLFVAYGGGHVTMLIPVARRAIENGHQVVFLGLTTAQEALARAGIPSIGFSDLWNYAAPRARTYGRQLAAQLPDGRPVSMAESEAYLGISFADLVATQGESAAECAFSVQGRQAFLPVNFLERVIGSLRPAMVIATNSPRAEQAAILAAGRLGVPSLCLVDLFALHEVRWIGQPGYASKVCVLNEEVKQMFCREGRHENEIVVTGNPAFDALNDPEVVASGTALRVARGWNDRTTTLLWASQPEPKRHPFNGVAGNPLLPRQIEQVLRRLVRDQPGFRLVVRYHPSEQESFVSEARVELSPKSESLPILLHAVDLVVVTASTVGLEAFIAGRPVISVDNSVFTLDAPYSRMGISTGVRDTQDLPSVLIQAAANLHYVGGNAVSEHGRSGGAAQRVLAVIESLILDGACQ